MSVDYEYVVIGSGPSGTMAAQTLIDAGRHVAMVDVGILGRDYEATLPQGSYEELRRTDPNQYRYLLGDQFESVDWDDIKVGAQLTPARKHLAREVERLIPMISQTFFPMESMAYGGLGSGWGLGAYVYSDQELARAGLSSAAMRSAYQVVCDRVGISAGQDDVSRYVIGHLANTLPPLQMDNSTQQLYKTYQAKRRSLNKRGIYFGNPAMALLSTPFNNRKATRYDDMDFYTDRDRAGYRPWITLNVLREHPNFTYLGGLLALRFYEDETSTFVEVLNVHTNQSRTIKCRVLILAAGVLGSARIVLRSFKKDVRQLSLLCNPYSYLPCLHLRMLGTPLSAQKTSMAQAFMIYDEKNAGNDIVSMAIYTYRSLMLYKIIKEAPLDFSDGLGIFSILQSALMIVGIHHPDAPSPKKYLRLMEKADSPTGDALFAHYELDGTEAKQVAQKERTVRSIFAGLGCYPLRSVRPGFGGSIHYAGSLPFHSSELAGTTSSNGRLHKTRSVFVADGSGFNYLPAKGVTLTLMANAHVTALNALAHE
ncbi:MAG: hypothetical protein HXY38_10005 [Chloroflexi bacterium]|nr:hypothetical protein [Chloroflexota bacterium]